MKYRVASTPITSSRSSSVTKSPRRLDIANASPSWTRWTNCRIGTSTVSGSPPSAAIAAFSVRAYAWWSDPTGSSWRSNPRSRFSCRYAMSAARYVGSPLERTTTRSLSSPNSVVRSHNAPSDRYRSPPASSSASARSTMLGDP